MRIEHLLCLLVLAAVSCAQDTNFSVGPQYLITSDSMFLRPIATPSLSLSEPLPSIRASSEEAAVPETAAAPVKLSSHEFFARVYWGEHTPEEVTARLIVTPTLSLSEQSLVSTAATTEEATPRKTSAGLGREASAAREVPQVTRPLFVSVVQVGVTGTADAQSLRESGYGVSLGEAAISAKTKPHATRVFTNRDIERLQAEARSAQSCFAWLHQQMRTFDRVRSRR
jgi:hypothetical protein